MDTLTTCNQHECMEPAAYRFTWPGRDEAGICEKHVEKLRGVAEAMGLHLQVRQITSHEAGRKEAT